MTRNQWIGAAAAAVVLAFLIGFFVSWSRARTLDRQLGESRTELEATRFELELYQTQGRLGAALAEAQRSNYERVRQLMTQVFSELDASRDRIADPERRQAAELILAQRDEIITQLSRAEPESVQRLMLLYTRMFAAVDPIGRDAPATVTPPGP
jgi:septal ring factor EnvC (AmiA/AmiB activator)